MWFGKSRKPTPTPAPEPSPEPSPWDHFAARLAFVIRDLPERTYLIVSSSTLPAFVQFTIGAPEDPLALWAEIYDGPFSDVVRSELVAAGFSLNLGDTGTWATWVAFPSPMADYRRIASLCARAVVDVGVPSPDDLVYKSWRDPERLEPGVTYDPDELDAGADPVELPALGLRRES